MWEQALTGLQEAYKPQIEQTQQATAYDISQAYANYKKSQLSLMRNRYLGSGYKTQQMENLESAYGASYLQSKAKEAQSLYETQSAFGKDVAALESQFAEYGEKLAALDKAIYEYAGADINKARLGLDEGGLGHYELGALTGAGKSFYDEQLTRITKGGAEPTQSFDDWLLEQEYDDLYEFYTSDPQRIKMLLGGEEVADSEYTSDEKFRAESDRLQREYEKRIGAVSDKKFSSYEEKQAYYSEQIAFDDLKKSIDAGLKDPDSQGPLRNMQKILRPIMKKETGSSSVVTLGGTRDKPVINIDASLGDQEPDKIRRLKEAGFVLTPKSTHIREGVGPNATWREGVTYDVKWSGTQKELESLLANLYNIKA